MALVVLKYKIKKGWEKILQKPAKQVKKKRKEEHSMAYFLAFIIHWADQSQGKPGVEWSWSRDNCSLYSKVLHFPIYISVKSTSILFT